MSEIVYGRGGYRPNHPSQGRVLFADDDTETVTRWDDAGAQIERRAYTADEKADKTARLAAEARGTNGRTIEQRARAFIAENSPSRQYLDNASPTQAQTVAQVKRNTRAVLALIKLHFGELDTIDGT